MKAPTALTQLCHFKNEPSSIVTAMPRLSIPAKIRAHSCIMTNYSVLAPLKPLATIPNSFNEWLDNLPEAEQRLLNFFSELAPHSQLTIEKSLRTDGEMLEAGSDGGKIETGGSFAWLLLTSRFQPMWRCAGPVDGWTRCQSSLRSELVAIASLCLALEEFCLFRQIMDIKCKICIYIDNLQAIKHLKELQIGKTVRKYEANADALSIIAACPTVLAQLKPSHVKAHQDDKKHPSELDRPAQVNILCDKLATLYMDSMLLGPMTAIHTPGRPQSLPIEVQVINSHYTKRLHKEIGAGYHQDYVCKKFKWSQQTYAWIDWTAIKNVAKKTSINQLATISKLMHNWLPLGQKRKQLALTKEVKAIAENCPCCWKQPETFIHFLICPEPQLLRARFEALESV